MLEIEAIVLGCLLPSIYSAYTDAKQRMIYDYITVPVFLAGLFYSLYVGTWQNTVPAAAAVFFILFAMALKGGIAGGDVKFSTALAIWFGFPLIIYVIGIGSLLAFVWGAVILTKNGTFAKRMLNMVRHFYLQYKFKVDVIPLPTLPENDEISPEDITFGPFLAIAAWAVFILQGVII